MLKSSFLGNTRLPSVAVPSTSSRCRQLTQRIYARDILKPEVDFKMRKGNSADVPEIMSLVWEEKLNPLGIVPERFTVAIENGTGRLLGCVQVEPKPYSHKVRYYELRTMIVGKDYRNRGIGRALLEEALSSVPRDADVWLTTIPASASFYARHGFDIVRDDFKEVPNEIFFEQAAGQLVAGLFKKTNVLVLRREKKPIETPKYF